MAILGLLNSKFLMIGAKDALLRNGCPQVAPKTKIILLVNFVNEGEWFVKFIMIQNSVIRRLKHVNPRKVHKDTDEKWRLINDLKDQFITVKSKKMLLQRP